MSEEKKRTAKQRIAVMVGNILEDISELVVRIPCTGPWYEPEMPKELQDK